VLLARVVCRTTWRHEVHRAAWQAGAYSSQAGKSKQGGGQARRSEETTSELALSFRIISGFSPRSPNSQGLSVRV
jgi:hypothetical protein